MVSSGRDTSISLDSLLAQTHSLLWGLSYCSSIQTAVLPVCELALAFAPEHLQSGRLSPAVVQ